MRMGISEYGRLGCCIARARFRKRNHVIWRSTRTASPTVRCQHPLPVGEETW